MVAQSGAPPAEAEAPKVQQAAHQADGIKLDRSAFTEVLKLKALRVPTARCQELMKRFSGCATARPPVAGCCKAVPIPDVHQL